MSERIVVTRSREQAADFAAELTAVGFTPVIFPVIQFEALPPGPLDAALARIEQYDWLVFTSGNGVDFFCRRVAERAAPLSLPPVAAVGSATKRKLAARGIAVDFMPAEFTGEQLVLGLGNVTGQRVLLPRAKKGRPQIVRMLRERGALVDDVALYDTVTAVPTPAALADLAAGFDALTFTSPSSVRNFLKIVGASGNPEGQKLQDLISDAVIACIGPVTAAAAEKNGLSVRLTPEAYTIPGLVQVLSTYFKL